MKSCNVKVLIRPVGCGRRALALERRPPGTEQDEQIGETLYEIGVGLENDAAGKFALQSLD